MKSKITLSFARLLRQLLVDEVNRGDFRTARPLLEKFLEDGVLDFRIIGEQQQKIFCPNQVNLHQYLQNKFSIPSLEDYIFFLEAEDTERSDAVRATSDSKAKKVKVLQGFMINAFDTIVAELNGNPFVIKPTHGTYTFIASIEKFIVPEDYTIVVVEGHENFRAIERQKYLFEGIKPLFLWRYQNTTAIADWLALSRRRYIHFGDFDLAGIHIYLKEFKSKLPDNRSSFLIPGNIEDLLKTNGARFLYEDHKHLLPSIGQYSLGDDLMRLVDLIRLHKKGLSQEILIKKSGDH